MKTISLFPMIVSMFQMAVYFNTYSCPAIPHQKTDIPDRNSDLGLFVPNSSTNGDRCLFLSLFPPKGKHNYNVNACCVQTLAISSNKW